VDLPAMPLELRREPGLVEHGHDRLSRVRPLPPRGDERSPGRTTDV